MIKNLSPVWIKGTLVNSQVKCNARPYRLPEAF